MDEKKGYSSVAHSKKPALKFGLLLLLVFVFYATWHILIGRNLEGVLPRIPGRLPKNDPVRSLYDAFQASFLLGFLSVFVIAMFFSSIALLIKKYSPREMSGFKVVYVFSGLAGFIIDAIIILILEKGHGAWNYWPDIRSEWQAVVATTALISLSGGITAVTINWGFLSINGKGGESWRNRFLLGTGWWVMMIMLAWLIVNSHMMDNIISHDPWWLALIIIGSFFIFQTVPFWLTLNISYPAKRRNNIFLALLMPFLVAFGFLATFVTYVSMNFCCID